jgi:hypothetical protein
MQSILVGSCVWDRVGMFFSANPLAADGHSQPGGIAAEAKNRLLTIVTNLLR